MLVFLIIQKQLFMNCGANLVKIHGFFILRNYHSCLINRSRLKHKYFIYIVFMQRKFITGKTLNFRAIHDL